MDILSRRLHSLLWLSGVLCKCLSLAVSQCVQVFCLLANLRLSLFVGSVFKVLLKTNSKQKMIIQNPHNFCAKIRFEAERGNQKSKINTDLLKRTHGKKEILGKNFPYPFYFQRMARYESTAFHL